jgi:hypothetical protein
MQEIVMDAGLWVILSGSLTFGVPIVFGVRELLLLKPGRGGWSGDHQPDITPVPPTPGTDAPTKPLPACLIPSLPPRLPDAKPVRQLEPV